ncbi:MAG: SGNH/GDSL hydrolase family protein [Niabella sp.]|nr:SGNH/GDSL hydrolase family protein [Niabella sp.]
MKKILIAALFTGLAVLLYAQQPPKPSVVYTDAFSLRLIGQVFPLKKSYHRIDTAAYADFSPGIKKLFTNGAGLAISFKTNSPRITAKWCVTNARQYDNMTPIANKGLDLYIKRNGKWEFAGVGRADAVCNEFVIVQNMDRTAKECLLYLPLYDEVKSLSVGVDSGCQISPGKDPFPKRVVVYGSSITQGAAASRPGMAYPARLSRALGIDFINLGLSGSGKMERNVADMLATADADAFILDCFANPSPEQITERTAYLVKVIRAKHPDAPIVMIQSVIRQSGNFDSTVQRLVERQNENTLKEYQKLKKEGLQHLYLISGANLLGNDHEGSTDGIHPNDLGFDRMLQVIRPEIIRILKSNQVIK